MLAAQNETVILNNVGIIIINIGNIIINDTRYDGTSYKIFSVFFFVFASKSRTILVYVQHTYKKNARLFIFFSFW